MKTLLARFKDLKPLPKAALCLGAAVLFYTLFGFLAAPPILKAVLENKLPRALNRGVTIDRIRLNPYALSATVEGFRLAKKDGEGDLLSFERLYVNLEGLSLFKKALIIRSVSLTAPAIDITRIDGENYSISDLLAPRQEGTPEPEGGPALFSINNIEIERGRLLYHDLPKGTDHRIEDLALAIPSISNLPSSIELFVQPVFSAVVNGTEISLSGNTKLFAESRATEVEVKMTGIDIPEYLAYIPNPTGLTVKSALFDIDTRLTYLVRPDEVSRLGVTGTLGLREVEVTDREGRSYFRLPAVTVAVADSDLLAGDIHLAEVVLDAPQLTLSRQADGGLLPLTLLGPGGQEPPQPPAPAAETSTAGEAVRVTVDRFVLNGGEVLFSDASPATPARAKVSAIAVTAKNLSTVPGTSGGFDFSLAVNDTGRLSGEGTIVLQPLAVKTTLDLENLSLPDFQPYVSEAARVVVTRGALAVTGTLDLRPGDEGFVFTGGGALSGLTTADTVNGEDLVSWKALRVAEVSFASAPPALKIGEIRLEGPFAKVLVTEKGTTNLASLSREERTAGAAGGAAPEEGAADHARIAIGRVVLANGAVEFLDRSVKPSYGLTLGQVNGMITGLSSEAGTLATVRIDARVDKQAPLEVSGAINPLSEEPQVDLAIDFKNFNLSPLSPYSGKYIGYKTEKGKLNLDLAYQIRGKRLESSNRVFLDQFTLGAAVDSPDATSLPVSLALALLKNRRGEITLDIPVRGDLDDPEFSVGGVVLQVLVNLVAKAATSPFALLGSLIPAGEDLQYVDFDPGTSVLTEKTAEKLSIMANVLHERPGLRIDLAGHVDRPRDSQALARARLEKLVQLEKIRKTGAPKGTGAGDQGVVVSGEDYPRYLEAVYKKAVAAAPPERRGAIPPGPVTGPAGVAAMEEFVLGGIAIGEEELRLLAISRANAVLGDLVGTGEVEPERLFVIEPQLTPPGEEGEDERAAVELVIR